MMEISKTLRDEILKIQSELKTAIQNHQILVLRQKENQDDDKIAEKLVEVQEHIRSVGVSQKALLKKLRHEVALKKLHFNNNNNHAVDDYSKNTNINSKDRSLLKPNVDHSSRTLLKYKSGLDTDRSSLQKNGEHNKPNLLFRSKDENKAAVQNTEYARSLLKSKSDGILLHKSADACDSSSEENKTPCISPNNLNEDDEVIPAKRIKATLQATPRPSSPAEPFKSLKASDSGSNSSEDSVDHVFALPYIESKENFMGSLGLITNDSMQKLQSKKSERKRRKRKCSAQHHWYSGLWDLTVLQKRNHNKNLAESRSTHELKKEDLTNNDDDSNTGDSPKYKICVICRKNGDISLMECRLCPALFHPGCSIDIHPSLCPRCSDRQDQAEAASADFDYVPRFTNKPEFTYEGKLKEKHQLLKKKAILKEELAALEDKAKNLSLSLVNQVTAVNHLSANEEKVRNSIKKVVDFVTAIQKSELVSPSVES